ncbi:hypothetical protein NQ317_017473 [Molorchus minor]|uniref:Uncharacterized protein n=1 Tax=Molorchus minor TaxID=1323400 RepID=A0ABQ9JTY8_9CUCU|nr:hypothetical protein NQ317_017473 [Molorchus minor]
MDASDVVPGFPVSLMDELSSSLTADKLPRCFPWARNASEQQKYKRICITFGVIGATRRCTTFQLAASLPNEGFAAHRGGFAATCVYVLEGEKSPVYEFKTENANLFTRYTAYQLLHFFHRNGDDFEDLNCIIVLDLGNRRYAPMYPLPAGSFAAKWDGFAAHCGAASPPHAYICIGGEKVCQSFGDLGN